MNYIVFVCMNSTRDIWIAFSIISSSVSCSAKNSIKRKGKCIKCESLEMCAGQAFDYCYQNTYDWNYLDTMMQVVNDRIRTLAFVALANLLCSTTMGRARLGSKIFAFYSGLMHGFRWRYLDSAGRSCCSATCQSLWSHHSTARVLHCTSNSTWSVALPFVDSIVVCGYVCFQHTIGKLRNRSVNCKPIAPFWKWITHVFSPCGRFSSEFDDPAAGDWLLL